MDPTVRPPRDARHGHWLRTVAALRRYDLRAAASHTSLVIAQGLADYRLDLSTVHLTRSSPGVSHRGGEVRIHRPIGVDLTGRDRVPTAIGVVQAGLEGVPLRALVAADAALHRRLVTTDELAEACVVLAGCRGIGPVRAMLREADARIESPGESIVGHRLRALGYVLIPQFRVAHRGADRSCHRRLTSLAWLKECAVVAEVPGCRRSAPRRLHSCDNPALLGPARTARVGRRCQTRPYAVRRRPDRLP
jgi:hypothetical protein